MIHNWLANRIENEKKEEQAGHTYVKERSRLSTRSEYFQRLYRQDCARVGLFSRTNQFFHGIRSCNNFRGSCAFPLTYFPLSTISLVELDRCAAVPYRKRIGANEYASFALVRSLFFFFFFLYFHRLSRFELTLCNSLLSIFYTLRSSSKNLQNHRSHFPF